MKKTLTSLAMTAGTLLLIVSSCGGGENVPGRGYGQGCSGAGDCGGSTPICAPDGICVACVSNGMCGGDVCGTAGLCGDCVDDSDCPSGEPYCDASRSRCFECRGDGDCSASEGCGPRGECESLCDTAVMCDGGDVCAGGVCIECGNDSDCPADEPLCLQGKCRQCGNPGDCSAGQPYCLRGECEECLSDADCGPDEVCDAENSCD